jgi:predicted Zn-dependent protease
LRRIDAMQQGEALLGAADVIADDRAGSPNYQLARLSRASVNVIGGDFAAADADLDPILQATPNNCAANYLRSLEQVEQKQYEAADRTFDRICALFQAAPQLVGDDGLLEIKASLRILRSNGGFRERSMNGSRPQSQNQLRVA